MLLGANTGLIIPGAWGTLSLITADKEKLGLRLFFLRPVLVRTITHFPLVTESRMQVPIMPFLLVLAATSLHRPDLTGKGSTA